MVIKPIVRKKHQEFIRNFHVNLEKEKAVYCTICVRDLIKLLVVNNNFF